MRQFTTDTSVFDVDNRTSVLHGMTTAKSSIGPYEMECCLIMSFNETREKIVHIKEMFDSAAYGSFMARVQQHMAAEGGESNK